MWSTKYNASDEKQKQNTHQKKSFKESRVELTNYKVRSSALKINKKKIQK